MSKDAETREIIIYPAKMKMLKTNARSLLPGILLVFPAVAYRRSTKLVARIISVVARGLLFIGGLLFLPTLYWLLLVKPMVRVNAQGISYNAPWTVFLNFSASITWEEIAALYISELTMSRRGRSGTYRLLCVLPKDLESFLRRYKLLNMTVRVIVMKATDTPFMIPDTMLPVTADELLSRIREQYADEIQAHGIELREVHKTSLTSSKR